MIDISGNVLYDKEHAKNELLALVNVTVSHEMRNPLNSIISLTDDARFQLKEMKRHIETRLSGETGTLLGYHSELERISQIQTSSSRLLLFFVNDILDFSKIKARKFKKNITCFNVREAVEEIVSIQQQQADALRTRIETNFQNISENIKTDKQRMQQILLNLVSNSLKFTHSGLVTITCSMHVEDGAWNLKVTVRDTGIGISEEDQKKLFLLFGVLEST